STNTIWSTSISFQTFVYGHIFFFLSIVSDGSFPSEVSLGGSSSLSEGTALHSSFTAWLDGSFPSEARASLTSEVISCLNSEAAFTGVTGFTGSSANEGTLHRIRRMKQERIARLS